MAARLAAAAAAAALVAVHVAAVESAVRVFNSSNLGCQNIYPYGPSQSRFIRPD